MIKCICEVLSSFTIPTYVLSCFSRVWPFVTPWTVACQVPLSLGFSRQECWSGLPHPPSEDLPDSGIESMSPASPALQAFYCWGTGETLQLSTSKSFDEDAFSLLVFIECLIHPRHSSRCCVYKHWTKQIINACAFSQWLTYKKHSVNIGSSHCYFHCYHHHHSHQHQYRPSNVWKYSEIWNIINVGENSENIKRKSTEWIYFLKIRTRNTR